MFQSQSSYKQKHLTIAYLFLIGFEGAVIEDFQWNNSGSTTNPAALDFGVNVTFSPDSSFVPSQELLDSFISRAFAPENVETLLLDLQKLPSNDPFSRVNDATYRSNVEGSSQAQAQNASMRTFTTLAATSAGVSIALSAGLIALALSTYLSKRRMRRRHDRYRTKSSSPDWLEATQASASDAGSVSDGYLTESDRLVRNISAWTAAHDSFDDMEIEFFSVPKRRRDHLDDPLFQSPFTASSTR